MLCKVSKKDEIDTAKLICRIIMINGLPFYSCSVRKVAILQVVEKK